MAKWSRDGRGLATEQIMETENNHLTNQLASKISRLKMISLDMKDNVEEDNRYLDEMGSDFMSTTGLLTGTSTRFRKMMDSGKGNRKLMCYIISIFVVLFLFIYFVLMKSKVKK